MPSPPFPVCECWNWADLNFLPFSRLHSYGLDTPLIYCLPAPQCPADAGQVLSHGMQETSSFLFLFSFWHRSPSSSPGCPAWTLSTGYPWPRSFPAFVLKVPGIRGLWARWFKAAFSKTDCSFSDSAWKVGGIESWLLHPLATYLCHHSDCQGPGSLHLLSCHRMQDLDRSVLKSIWFLLLSKISLSFTFDR